MRASAVVASAPARHPRDRSCATWMTSMSASFLRRGLASARPRGIADRSLGSVVPALWMRRRRRTSRRRSVALALDGILRDIRLAVRLAVRQKSFTLAVLVTFGLGIGATTAVVSVVDPVLVRPLPLHGSLRARAGLVGEPSGIARNSVSPPDFFDFQEQAPTAHRARRLSHPTTRRPSSFSVNRHASSGRRRRPTSPACSASGLCSDAGSHPKRPEPTRQSSC